MARDSTGDGTDEPRGDIAAALRTDGGSDADQESADDEAVDDHEETAERGHEQAETAEESEEQATEQEAEIEESKPEAPAEEPTTVEADDEAVAEQTGDAGVEPADEGAEAETTGEETASTPSHDDEGDTASILEIRNQVRELSTDVIGRSLDGIIEISRSDGVWRAVVEVIERRSVPDTQDILGQYEIELDENGEVIGYRRLEKYRRSDTGPSRQ